MKKTVIIAAAGMGNRLGAGKPKCLVQVNGHAIFEYLLKAFEWADEIRMVVGYNAEEVTSAVSSVNHNIKFIFNENYANTTTLQSNYLGCSMTDEKVLFIDGDMIISHQGAKKLLQQYEMGDEFAGVTSDISEDPVYAGVKKNQIEWFDYDRISDYEWANIALLNANKLEYEPTHFFVQIEKYLPIKACEIERLEIDTPFDLRHAESMIIAHPEKYDYWER